MSGMANLPESTLRRLEETALDLEDHLLEAGLRVVKTRNDPKNVGMTPELALVILIRDIFSCRDFGNCSL
jgi:hypothetical protein